MSPSNVVSRPRGAEILRQAVFCDFISESSKQLPAVGIRVGLVYLGRYVKAAL